MKTYNSSDIVIKSINYSPIADIFYSKLVDDKFAFIEKSIFSKSFKISINPFSESQFIFANESELFSELNRLEKINKQKIIDITTLEQIKPNLFIAKNLAGEFTFATKTFFKKEVVPYTDYWDLPITSLTKETLISSNLELYIN